MDLFGLPNETSWGWLALEALSKDSGAVVLVRPDEENLLAVQDTVTTLRPLFPDLERPETAFFGADSASWAAALRKVESGARLILVHPEALDATFPSRDAWKIASEDYELGENYPRNALLETFEKGGYARTDFVEDPGEFAIRGSVVDLFLPEPAVAVRLLFAGDRLESIREFDPATQRTTQFIDRIRFVPARTSGTAPGRIPLREWMGDGALWHVPESIAEEKESVLTGDHLRVVRDLKPVSGEGEDFGARPNVKFQGQVPLAAGQLADWIHRGRRAVLVSINRGEEERILELLAKTEPRVDANQLELLRGPLPGGFLLDRENLGVLPVSEIFERSYGSGLKFRKAVGSGGKRTRWRDLRIGDFVVHEDFGVSRYLGLRPIEGQDCLSLEYKAGDKVYVPLYEFRKVQKYVGAEGKEPTLSRLGARSWQNVKESVRENARELAQKLLEDEAKRLAAEGARFSDGGQIEREFADSFPYDETQDQERTIKEVLRDLSSNAPMNRVVIGDVGFGKTEVAMRATMRAAMAGKQVAVVVPTTVLADQHYRNFEGRFAEYPVSIRMMSRFQSKSDQKETLKALAEGRCDVVIGTHRLLSKDVAFKGLGLIIVDEEHRFGVKHKNRLQAIRYGVDTLALSATPIPRTLYQTLSGLREISVISTPPAGRQPINTHVGPFDEGLVREAIQAELARGGQVFYVHNQVRTLPARTAYLQRLLPGVRFAMAHGQMKGEELESRMWDFHNRKYDVLVASTIIESGLDLSTVNTIVVERAQRFGLAQLYQLRGRIGRSQKKGFCFLFYGGEEEEGLTEIARKRLGALREFAELGSGFRLAMRDLEIRGAGDLLGSKQHGFLNAVGLELYCEMLNEEVAKLKGKKGGEKKEPDPVSLDIRLDASIPESYFPDEMERLKVYKRLLAARPAQVAEIRAELEDLAGPPPEPVENLFKLISLRESCGAAGLRSVEQKRGELEIYFRPDAGIEPPKLVAWTQRYGDKIQFLPSAGGDGVRLEFEGDPVKALEGFLGSLVAA